MNPNPWEVDDLDMEYADTEKACMDMVERLLLMPKGERTVEHLNDLLDLIELSAFADEPVGDA